MSSNVLSPQVQTLQAVGLAASLILPGVYFSSSQLAIPLIYNLSPTISTRAFAQLYHEGLKVVVTLGITGTLASAGLAYLLPEKRTTYITAAVGTFISQPWTIVVMKGTIDTLLRINDSAVEKEKVSLAEVQSLLSTWSWMNMVRAVMSLGGGLTGVYALLP